MPRKSEAVAVSVRRAGRVHPYPRAGRPRDDKSGAAESYVTFGIPPALKALLATEARQSGITVSALVRKVVHRAMKRRASNRKVVDMEV